LANYANIFLELANKEEKMRKRHDLYDLSSGDRIGVLRDGFNGSKIIGANPYTGKSHKPIKKKIKKNVKK